MKVRIAIGVSVGVIVVIVLGLGVMLIRNDYGRQYRNKELHYECIHNMIDLFAAIVVEAEGAAERKEEVGSVGILVSRAIRNDGALRAQCAECAQAYLLDPDVSHWLTASEHVSAVAIACPCVHRWRRESGTNRVITFGWEQGESDMTQLGTLVPYR